MDPSELLDDQDESLLNEFVVSCLLDPKFPAFVEKVDQVLKKALKD